MKAWRLIAFAGACLLLANIPAAEIRQEKSVLESITSKASNLAERQGSASEIENANEIDSKIVPENDAASNVRLRKSNKKMPNALKHEGHAALYKVGDIGLVKPGKPFGKYVINCQKPGDCPEDSKCVSDNGICWCKTNITIAVRKQGSTKDRCLNLKSPCDNEHVSPCHHKAECKYHNKIHFVCQCKEGFVGDGLMCEKKKEPTTATVKPATTATARTRKFTTEPKPTKFHEKILKKALSIYHKVVKQVVKHLGLVITGAVSLAVMSLIILICVCRRKIRKRREKKLYLENMGEESFEGFEQQQFSSYPAQDYPEQYPDPYYENVNMDHILGPLPPTPVDAPEAPPPPPPPGAGGAAPPPPPPPPPPPQSGASKASPAKKGKGKKSAAGGRRASANRKAIHDCLVDDHGKRRSFADNVSLAQSIIAGYADNSALRRASQSSFYSDDEY